MGKGKQSKFFYGYIVLAAIWVIYFFNVATPLYGVSAINANMVAATGFDAAVVGTAVSISTAMQGVTSPVVGTLVAKKGVRLPLIIGSVLLVISGFCLAFLPVTPAGFILFYGVMVGAGMGFAGILTTQCTVNEWFAQKKAMAIALAVSAGGVGGFVLPLVCQAISDVRWNLGWLFIGATCCISVILSVFVMKNRPADVGEVPDGRAYAEKHAAVHGTAEAGPVYSLGKVFRTSAIWLVVVGSALRNVLYYATVGHIVLYLVGNGIPNVQAVATISVMSMASLIGRFVAGFITGKVLSARMEGVLSNLFCTAAIVLLVFCGQSLLLMNLGGALMGLGLGMGYISQPLVTTECYGKENFSAISGWTSILSYVAAAVGPLVAGLAAKATGSYVTIYLVFGALCAVGGLIMLGIRKPDPAELE